MKKSQKSPKRFHVWSLLRRPTCFHLRVSRYPNRGEKGGEGKEVYLHNIKKTTTAFSFAVPSVLDLIMRPSGWPCSVLDETDDQLVRDALCSVYGTVFMMAPRASSFLSTTASLLHQVHGPYSIFPSYPGTFLCAIFFLSS